ncbi:hypothetical protein FCM35_KLT00932 [Carex littledalei]|uniref:CCHC-type domain-containing protein n=1 Tax=Carex littledalei TaxID=544730 RepID=A0A833R4T7_9POAL|nr:hypothetical protein FCM35_KLT00932 [Carex littledalei]
MESWKRFWNFEEIRILVVASLCLQFGLVFLSPWRKRSARKPLIILLWSFYQVADYIAVLALSDILKKQNEGGGGDLTTFWAPFFLLHLGGPDTITSYSIEDNELWLRHTIGLAVQSSIAFMVILELLAIPRLFVAAAFVFITGFVKYAERTLALRSASMDQLRDSLVEGPDPGPNYSKFMEQYVRQREAGQSGYVKKKNEARQLELPSNRSGNINNDVKLIVDAYRFFKRFKPIAVDLMLTFLERRMSQTYLWRSNALEAFKIVEIELSFLYDVFHTKAIHIRGICGGISRFIYLGMISVAFIIFHNCEKQRYVNADIVISYILLGSALFMELTSLVLITTSDWMIVALTRHTWLNLNKLAGVITCAKSCIPRWSNSMNQYNLLSFSLGDKEESLIRRWVLGALKMNKLYFFKKVKELWNNFIFIDSVGVPCELKTLLFGELKKKSENARNTADFKELRDCKGEKALQKAECSHLRWSIDKEFDESIVIWHVATDLCFPNHGGANESCETGQGVVEHINFDANDHISYSYRKISLIMSNYMVYLLMMQPSMMPAGIGKIRFQDTCAEAKVFFRDEKKGLTEAEAREALLDVETEVDPIQVKGDRCKSVLFDACRLANELNLLPENERWDLISRVWVEMLCYAAIHCKTHHHVKRLNQGGEPLTHLWLLMAHMGIGEQYRVETGRVDMYEFESSTAALQYPSVLQYRPSLQSATFSLSANSHRSASSLISRPCEGRFPTDPRRLDEEDMKVLVRFMKQAEASASVSTSGTQIQQSPLMRLALAASNLSHSETRKCYNCGVMGHLSRVCPKHSKERGALWTMTAW